MMIFSNTKPAGQGFLSDQLTMIVFRCKIVCIKRMKDCSIDAKFRQGICNLLTASSFFCYLAL